jgi:hypothetical protein
MIVAKMGKRVKGNFKKGLELIEYMFYNLTGFVTPPNQGEYKMTKRNIVHIEIPDQEARQSRGLYEALFGRNITLLLDMNYANREFKAGNANLSVNDKETPQDLKRSVSPGPPQFQ